MAQQDYEKLIYTKDTRQYEAWCYEWRCVDEIDLEPYSEQYHEVQELMDALEEDNVVDFDYIGPDDMAHYIKSRYPDRLIDEEVITKYYIFKINRS